LRIKRLAALAFPELFGPLPDGLVCDNYPFIGQHVFDHAKAQWEAEVQPHCFGNDFGWKTIAAIKRGSKRWSCTIVDNRNNWQVKVAMPAQRPTLVAIFATGSPSLA
jgi:hypothetical protein